jgi:glycosyltransferase involved in cell wall biosynthesis
MRITFLAPHDSLNGGVRVVALYARLLQARGHSVHIVSSPRPRPTLREHARALRHGRWQELRERHRGLPGHLAQSGVPWHTLDQPRPIVAADVPDADVVIATWWETAVWMAALPASKGAKVHLVQGYETWGDPKHDGRVDAALRLPNVKIAISLGLKDQIEASLGPLGMCVVPNAVDTRQFDAPPRGRRSRPRVGFVYAQAPIKGADRYLEIVKLTRRELPDLEVLAFGADAVGAAMPLPEGTEYHRRPAQDQLAGLYARCDAWLFSTRVDSFGLPVLEAMACRTPVVGLPVGAAPDLLEDGCGVLVRPESEDVLAARQARALVDLLKGPEADWRAMSERAHWRAHGYSWEDAAERLETQLRQSTQRTAA